MDWIQTRGKYCCSSLASIPAEKESLMSSPAFVAYHDATAAYHQTQFDASDGLLKRGFRIQSLSVTRKVSRSSVTASPALSIRRSSMR